jgi:hypothetical protein
MVWREQKLLQLNVDERTEKRRWQYLYGHGNEGLAPAGRGGGGSLQSYKPSTVNKSIHDKGQAGLAIYK